MKLTGCLLLAVVTSPGLLGIGDCIFPPSPYERLNPGMVVFIGKPVSMVPELYGAVTVTFDVRELLWGPPGLRSIRVLLDDGYSNQSGEAEFFAVKPLRDGRYLEDNCVGLYLPSAHPFVQQFRHSVAVRQPVSVSVIAQWRFSVPVVGAAMRLHGNGRVFEGTIHDGHGWEIAALPRGDYEVTASRANFIQNSPDQRISILPGSRAPVRIVMESDSDVSGRIVDARGEPVSNSTFHLMGQGHTLSESRPVYESVASLRDAFLRVIGWNHGVSPAYPLSNSVRTNSDGRFVFRDVFPGWYYLVTDMSEVNQKLHLPFPKTYYPGVYDWVEAKQLVVVEGQSIHDVLFRLPDFGRKRRLQLQVLSEDGVPVRNAMVQDSGLDPSNEKVANSGVHKATGVDGRVSLNLWPISEYRLSAYFWGANYQSWSGNTEILAGPSDESRVIVLKGLRLRK